MSQWSEPVKFSDGASDPAWTMTAVFLLASPEFQPATDASMVEDVRVIDRTYRRAEALDLGRCADTESRLREFVGKPLAAFAAFMCSWKGFYAKIDMLLASPDAHPNPIANAIARYEQAVSECQFDQLPAMHEIELPSLAGYRRFRENDTNYVVVAHVDATGALAIVDAVFVVDRVPIDGPKECQAALAFVGRPASEWRQSLPSTPRD